MGGLDARGAVTLGEAKRKTSPASAPRRLRQITLLIDDPQFMVALEAAYAQAVGDIRSKGGATPSFSEFLAHGLLPMGLKALAAARARPHPRLVVLPEELRRKPR